MSSFTPGYIALHENGELRRRRDGLLKRLDSCDICPLDCCVNRTRGDIARCYSGRHAIVSSYTPHFGEEPALSGTRGVGNIFFGNCNLRCVYCQNYQISQNWKEEIVHAVSAERLAEMMIELQDVHRCHSIGFVSPTHFVPQIVEALEIAVPLGLSIPLVYNTNAYDSVDVLRMLDGIIDIYLPDVKYSDNHTAHVYSKIDDYVGHAHAALKEMYRQVGHELTLSEDGSLQKGLVIRHLVLPNDLAGTEASLRFISEELSPKITISLLAQYYPTHKVTQMLGHEIDAHLLLNRKIRSSEYQRALRLLTKYGFEHGWIQECESADYYSPDFTVRHDPFVDRRDFISQ